jgi:cytochrome c peroxidase
MPYFRLLILSSLLVLVSSKCSTDNNSLVLGPVVSPEDNEMSKEKVALGRKLFFDKRLSRDNSISCASCHHPEKAFTDGLKRSQGVDGQETMRNAPSLLNAAYLPRVMFDGELKTLEMQVTVPIQEHTEMDQDVKSLLKELREVPEYVEAAKKIFNREFDPWVLSRSIAAFQRSLVSQNSAFDRYWKGDKRALSKEARTGYRLFSQKLYCIQCHPAPHFTTYQVANNGLYLDYGLDNGRHRITLDEKDKGLFKIPSLRNIMLTAPYMHDGSITRIEDVFEHYSRGGAGHINQSDKIKAFTLSSEERQYLLAFFESLTDTSYMVMFRK